MKKTLFFAVCSLFFLTIDSAIANNPNLQPKAIPLVSNDQAITATNSAWIKKNAVINGAVAVNEQSFEEPLVSGFELSIDTDTNINGPVAADTVELEKNAAVTGDLYCNELTVGTGATPTSCDNPINEFPVIDPLPPFQFVQHDVESAPDHITGSNVVDFSGLPAAAYRDIMLGANNTICLSGEYHIRNLTVGKNSTVIFSGETEIRVAEAIIINVNSKLVPEDNVYDCDNEQDNHAGITASDIRFYVSGDNTSTGGSIDGSAFFGGVQGGSNMALLNANVYALNGNLEIGKDHNAFGCFIGVNVLVNQSADVTADCSFLFGNQPPVADPQSLATDGANPLDILLTGSDPEGETLIFDILSGPALGSLSAITPIVPASFNACSIAKTSCTTNADCPVGETCDLIEPPVTSAEVTYTPPDGSNSEDSFEFKVTDPEGLMGTAVVVINPDDPSPPAPEITEIIACGVPGAATELMEGGCSEETQPETPVEINLAINVAIPTGDTVSYTIDTPPSDGVLDTTNLSSGIVIYTPDEGFTGEDRFVFLAADTSGTGSSTSDLGAVFVNVNEPPELANDLFLETPENHPIAVSLTANAGGTGVPVLTSSSRQNKLIAPKSVSIGGVTVAGSTIAGNVSATDGANGDGKDDLPGPAPVLVAAGVDVNLSAPGYQTFDNATDFQNALGSGFTLFEDFSDPVGTDLKGKEILTGVVADTNMENLEIFSGNVMFGFDSTTRAAGNAFYELTMTENYDAVSLVIKSWDPDTPGPVTVIVTFSDNSEETILLTKTGGSESDPVFFGIISDRLFIDKIVLNEGPEIGGSGNEEVSLDDVTVANSVRGVARIQIEWDISSLPQNNPNNVENAVVTLTTEKGTVDNLDTMFYVGTADQNGTLDVTDFQAPVNVLPGVVMTVPPGASTGDEGTFSFNVTNALKSAISQGFSFFSIQGRVNEQLTGGGFQRGLQIHSSANGNLSLGKEPNLDVVLGGDSSSPVFSYRILSITGGTLRTPDGALVTELQEFNNVNFVDLRAFPAVGPESTMTVEYEATNGIVIDSALIVIGILTDDCILVGRPIGCSPDDL